MDLKLIEHGSSHYHKMVTLRSEILRKPLGLAYSKAQLESEKGDILIGAFDNDNIMGCCILSAGENSQIQLRQMAVSNAYQGVGIGAIIMKFAEETAKEKGFETIMMHARKTAVGFYQKLGYQIISNEFEEVSLPHFEMSKKLI
jgi:N-acetylglutamate synthase-like GNAT family acetyltransferase